MEQRLADTCRMTINERKFIEHALLSDLRVDGRRPFDYRRLTIKFGSEDGSAEVQLGQTHVMAFVTSQLVQPYRDRSNEGTLSIFTEFSPMADPSFEPGRRGEIAVELGRIIDRGLRESRAIDMESLCVLAGKLVWAIRVDLHILDNGGNLIDAANVAALAALLTFRRPECTLGGDDGQEVTVHPPEVFLGSTASTLMKPLKEIWAKQTLGILSDEKGHTDYPPFYYLDYADVDFAIKYGLLVEEPLPLIIHHLPVAVTFAFFDSGNILVVDPTHNEEAVMGGRMTATMNTGGDVCSVQKAGGEGVIQSVIMQCMRVASLKAADITSKIKSAVEAYNTERAMRKVKHQLSLVCIEVDAPDVKLRERKDPYVLNEIGESLEHHEERLKEEVDERCGKKDGVKIGTFSSQQEANRSGKNVKNHIRGPSNWDPYTEVVSPDLLRSFRASSGPSSSDKEKNKARKFEKPNESKSDDLAVEHNAFSSAPVEPSASDMVGQVSRKKSLLDAVKPKNQRRK